MKTIKSTLPDEKAKKEVGQFAYAGLAGAVLAVLLFPWLMVVGLAFGVRSLLLTYHTANNDRDDLTKLRIMGWTSIALSLLALFLEWS